MPTCVSWPLQLPLMPDPDGVAFFLGVPTGGGASSGGSEADEGG